MLNVTFSLPEETVSRLREAARRTGGSKKGAISEFVDAAVKEHLQEVESRAAHEEFRAVRGHQTVATAGSLRELARTLEERRIDPRRVLIVSSIPLTSSKIGPRRHVD